MQVKLIRIRTLVALLGRIQVKIFDIRIISVWKRNWKFYTLLSAIKYIKKVLTYRGSVSV